MNKEGPDIITLVIQALPAMGLSLFGSFAEVMASPKTINVRFMLGSFAAAAFVGLVVYLLLNQVEIHESIKAVIISLAGASARNTMLVLQTYGQKLLKRVMK